MMIVMMVVMVVMMMIVVTVVMVTVMARHVRWSPQCCAPPSASAGARWAAADAGAVMATI